MVKPRILMSKCFFEAVRYDGERIADPLVEKIKPYLLPIPFCPEADFGLGVPRPKIMVMKIQGERRILQEDTKKDLTEEMKNFFLNFLSGLPKIEGALLKSKSPSCGVGSAKFYEGNKIIGKTDGLFASTLKELFLYLPLEDEGRLRDKSVYYHFLTRIFVLARFRSEVLEEKASTLNEFHHKSRILLKTYHKSLAVELERLVKRKDLSLSEKISLYENYLKKALSEKPDRKRHANTLYHLMSSFSKRVTPRERNHLINLIEAFREGKVTLKVPLKLIKNFFLRFEEKYLLKDLYLNPFPEELF